MNSRMTACASCFTLGGMSPFTITFRRLYFLSIENECVTVNRLIASQLPALTLIWCRPSVSRTASFRIRLASDENWFSSASHRAAAHQRLASKTLPARKQNRNQTSGINGFMLLWTLKTENVYWNKFHSSLADAKKKPNLRQNRNYVNRKIFLIATKAVSCKAKQHKTLIKRKLISRHFSRSIWKCEEKLK